MKGDAVADEKILDHESALENLADDREIYKEVLNAYMEDTPGIIEELNTAFDNSNIALVSRQAHSLKSSSRTIGGMRLGNVAAELEANSKEDSLDGIKELIEKIKEEFRVLKQEIAATGLF